jgi:hypothetical protein
MRSNIINYNDKTLQFHKPVSDLFVAAHFIPARCHFFWWNLHMHLSFVHSQTVTLHVVYSIDSPQLLVSFVSHLTLNLKLAPFAVCINEGVCTVQV